MIGLRFCFDWFEKRLKDLAEISFLGRWKYKYALGHLYLKVLHHEVALPSVLSRFHSLTMHSSPLEISLDIWLHLHSLLTWRRAGCHRFTYPLRWCRARGGVWIGRLSDLLCELARHTPLLTTLHYFLSDTTQGIAGEVPQEGKHKPPMKEPLI